MDSIHQGVQFSSSEDPVLYLNDPDGMSRHERRKMLDKIAELNDLSGKQFNDPEITTKIQQYEMAYRMQTAVPEIMDVSKEPDDIVKMYGPDCLVPGTYAANCLLARRMAERGVRFIQLYHRAWDHHGGIRNNMAGTALEVDRASAALITDLKQPWGDSETCTSCGKCVQVCPTGALFEKTSVGNKTRKHPEFLPYLRIMREGEQG